MANESNENDKPESVGEMAAGIVDAVAQDMELAVEQMGDAARDVIVAVEKKLRRQPKPRAKKPKAKARPARKPAAKKPKAKARAARKAPAKKPKAKTRKVAKTKKRNRR